MVKKILLLNDLELTVLLWGKRPTKGPRTLNTTPGWWMNVGI